MFSSSDALWSSPLAQELAAVLYVLLSVIVTIDVLLKKSDVRGALGWIGLVWLAPILGSLLYYMFGINRVTRRALKLRMDRENALPGTTVRPDAAAHIVKLSDVSQTVTQCPLTGGNALDILEGGDAAYPAMLAAIRGAKSCIAMSSYIFRNDAAGNEFADALIEAAQRGVRVRVLLDGVGMGYFYPAVYYRMKRSGVTGARFLHTWLPWRMPFLNMRNHRKLLVVDGAVAFVGGINIGTENYARTPVPRRVQDVHFCVRGPAVKIVMDAFARDWTFTTDEELDDDGWWPDEIGPQGSVFVRGLRSGPDGDLYRLESLLGAALSLAQKRVRIVTPYFLPDARLQFAIQQAALRGVAVEIVLPFRSDQRVMDWAMRGHLRFFRHVGASFSATSPPFDHSKLCTVDGEWSLIGSSNWDARSFRLNFEFDLEIIDRDLTARIDALIDERIGRGTMLTPDMLAAEPLWIRLRNAAARLAMPYL